MKQRKTEKEVFLCLMSSQHKPHREKRMVSRWTMGHSGWMSVLLLVYGFRTGSCDISLTMEKTVTGVKGDSVVIPCTYTVSGGDDVVKILWEFHGNPVIFRIDSEDHTPQVHNRQRAALSKSPGDASLTLKKLDIGDRGNFKCKITGRDKGGKAIEKEGVTILKVNRKKTDTSDVESATMGDNDFEPTRPATERPHVTTPPAKPTTRTVITINPDVKVTTVGKETASSTEYRITEKPNKEGEVTARRGDNTRAPDAEDDSAIANTKQPRKFDASTSPANPLPTDIMHNDPVADAVKGSGIFFYVLIIGLLCVIFILILTIVLVVRRKRRKSFHYDIPTMNQLALNVDGRPCSGGGCQSPSNDYQYTFTVSEHVTIPSCSNDYEHTFPVSEYVALPACSNEYEQLKYPQDNDNHVSPSE